MGDPDPRILSEGDPRDRPGLITPILTNLSILSRVRWQEQVLK